jgi:bacterioferritin (cytochrome b1)
MSHFSELDAATRQAMEDMRHANAAIQRTVFADDEPFDAERFLREGDA